jgi:murein DD-endopeptidase MepM/ murein hydrolase activator NlpD
MGGLNYFSPEPPKPGAHRRDSRGSRWARVAVPGFALAIVAVAAVVALAAGSVLISKAAVEPTSTPSPTPTPLVFATAVATPTPQPTPTPVPVPTVPPGPPTPTPPSQLTGYVWPLVDARVTLPFGPSPYGDFIVNGQLFHDGVDMATKCGDNVMAAHDGVVLTAGRMYVDFMGWNGDLTLYKKKFARPAAQVANLPVVIVIDDGDGYRSIYAHEWPNVKVKPGQHVKAGQVIGYEGATGNATGCHVHFGLYSPLETATFANLPIYMKVDHLPATETARIDPLLVLPYRNDVTEMQTLRPADAAAWAAAHPSASPAAHSSASH